MTTKTVIKSARPVCERTTHCSKTHSVYILVKAELSETGEPSEHTTDFKLRGQHDEHDCADNY
jgi:hypothetical protein